MPTIFHLPSQKELVEAIRSRLKQNIGHGLEVQRVEIDPKYSTSSTEEMHQRCRDFVEYMRVSLVTTDPFAVVIKNDLETQWCYMGRVNSVLHRGGYCFELKSIEMTSLFPALVLMNRVVMMPEEFDRKINRHPRAFLSLTRPLDLGGLELVDYHSDRELNLAIDRVSEQFRRELRSLIHRQKLVRRLFSPDYEELARLLREDVSILEPHESPSLDVDLVAQVQGRAIEGTPSQVSIEISNRRSRELRNVRIRVRGPKGAFVSAVTGTADLLPPDVMRIDFELIAGTAPCCPLEVFIDLGETPLEMPTFPITLFVEVDPQPAR